MRLHTALWACLAAGLAFPALAQAPGGDRPTATARFVDLEGKEIGSATLTDTPHGVIIRAELEGLKSGELSFHIHETGKCESATKFESAGGHFNPGGHEHGFLNEDGPHAGDMPNQFVGDDGRLSLNVIDPMVTFGTTGTAASDAGALLDGDGSALVIHAGADDYASQPAGNAGDRIACAVIEPAK